MSNVRLNKNLKLSSKKHGKVEVTGKHIVSMRVSRHTSQRKCIKLICLRQPSSSVRPKGTHEEMLNDSVHIWDFFNPRKYSRAHLVQLVFGGGKTQVLVVCDHLEWVCALGHGVGTALVTKYGGDGAP